MMNPWNSHNCPAQSTVEAVAHKNKPAQEKASVKSQASCPQETLFGPEASPGNYLIWSAMGIQSMNCSDDFHDGFAVASSSAAIPRRNLADAFEQHADAHLAEVSTTPAAKQHFVEESPLGVADFDASASDPVDGLDDDVLPHFHLHADLQRDLSQALVDRVSFYSIVHDINKEAAAMASNDFISFSRVKSMDEEDEVFSPVVIAVNGKPSRSRQALSMTETALIDEEQWILSVIESTTDDRSISECPPTFHQAMGEREYDRSETTRTQLWKPSRSWWEAKSGKNPWIEPKSHNKRWRYLWPLIHYHKFMAKCIKKLKRNGVDVKTSVSPVGVFLREEVCAVSDHLAAVSLFGSERWMECLEDFEGWTDLKSEAQLRKLIERVKLRPLDEPGDVDSPLLRSQIDEQFLRAMVATRECASGNIPPQVNNQCVVKPTALPPSVETDVTAPSSRHGLPLHPRRNASQATTPDSKSRIRSNISSLSEGGGSNLSSRGAPYVYHGKQWWGNGRAPHFAVCDENTSVHSALSGDSHPFGYPPSHYDTNMQGMFPMPFFHPHAVPVEYSSTPCYPTSPPIYPHTFDPMNHPEYALGASAGWYGHDPNFMYGNGAGIPVEPTCPLQNESDQTGLSPSGVLPSKQGSHNDGDYSPNPSSSFWGQMDYHMYQTLAHAGIMTPHKGHAPSSSRHQASDDAVEKSEFQAQPLLISHYGQYNPYGQMYGEGYMPPSPATQFMMSPQANAHAAAYYAAYNQNTFHSPPRPSTRRRSKRGSPPKSRGRHAVQTMQPPLIRKIAEMTPGQEETSDSDLTAATCPESESVVG